MELGLRLVGPACRHRRMHGDQDDRLGMEDLPELVLGDVPHQRDALG